MINSTAQLNFDQSSNYPSLTQEQLCWVYQGRCWCATIHTLTVIGLIGSLLTFLVVLLSDRLRTKSTFVYLLFLAAVDEMVLIYLSAECIHYQLTDPSIGHSCMVESVGFWVNDTLVYLSVIYVTAVTVERLIIVRWPLRAAFLCRRRTAIVACVATAMGTLVVNAYNLAMCLVTADTRLSIIIAGNYMFISVHSVLCLTIVAITVVILFQLSRSRARRSQMSSSTPRSSSSGPGHGTGSSRETFAQKTHALLLSTPISFTLLTWPKYCFDIWVTTMEMQGYAFGTDFPDVYYVMREGFYLLSKVNHCINFYLYVASARVFRDEIKQVFCRRRQGGSTGSRGVTKTSQNVGSISGSRLSVRTELSSV